ncbi:MAG: hypothetical protein K2R98_34435 [Gemmataceae bacterium]|nr:hypothetical protein [Gemmataceae bacterium]
MTSPHRILYALLLGLVAGCTQQAAGPPTDPAVLEREAEELKKQHERESQNK